MGPSGEQVTSQVPECEQVGGATMRTTVPVAMTFTACPSDQGQDEGDGECFDTVEKDVRGVSRPLGRPCDPVAFRPVGTHCTLHRVFLSKVPIPGPGEGRVPLAPH